MVVWLVVVVEQETCFLLVCEIARTLHYVVRRDLVHLHLHCQHSYTYCRGVSMDAIIQATVDLIVTIL